MCLAMDEAHLLSDIVLGWVGCEITMKDVKEFYLSSPPTIEYTESMSFFHHHDPCQQAIIYLRECIQSLHKQITSLSKHLKSKYNGPTVKRRLARAQNLLSSLQATVKAIETNASAWYVISGPGVICSRVGSEPGFVAKPLTSRYHFPSLFLHSPVTILMSGTIGDPKTFATELGLKEYQYRSVPSNYPPATRPIQILDVPHLNYRSTAADYNHQADAIAKAILDCPSDWSGIIHVTRKREGPLLADRLAQRGLQDRVFVTPDGATDVQMAAWNEHKVKTNGQYGGQLCIAWSMVEGVDLVDERICIVAKCQWPDTSDPYERARQRYSPEFYSLRTAWAVQQSLARTRRGYDEDYDLNGQREQLVCIADGSWTRLRRYFDPDFLESIQEANHG
jgi:Rad3-related DNA helicase